MPTEKDRISFLHDHMKHIATLSSSAIVILVSFSNNISVSKETLSISLAGFVFALLLALFSQTLLLVSYPLGDLDQKEKPSKHIDKTIIACWMVFVISMGHLAYAGISSFQ
jgi:hypothetical protein